MICTTAWPQSTMIHSPLVSPSMRGLAKPASRTASRTLAASALVCRFDVPEAMMTRSNKADKCSVSNTTISWALTSSRPSTMARWSFWMSFLTMVGEVGVVIKQSGKGGGGQYKEQQAQKPYRQRLDVQQFGPECRSR